MEKFFFKLIFLKKNFSLDRKGSQTPSHTSIGRGYSFLRVGKDLEECEMDKAGSGFDESLVYHAPSPPRTCLLSPPQNEKCHKGITQDWWSTHVSPGLVQPPAFWVALGMSHPSWGPVSPISKRDGKSPGPSSCATPGVSKKPQTARPSHLPVCNLSRAGAI